MQDYYKILGLKSSASDQEVRRAYRVLARRYHPDVNPEHADGEKFRAISDAYKVLSDPQKRSSFDAEFERKQKINARQKYEEYSKKAQQEFRARSRHAQAHAEMREALRAEQARRSADSSSLKEENLDFSKMATQVKKGLKKIFFAEPQAKKPSGRPLPKNPAARSNPEHNQAVSKISIIEVSVTAENAIIGVKKTVEILEPEGPRKVSVHIPAGTRNGSVVRLRNKSLRSEELVLIVRIASHPFLKIENKGLVVEIPITLKEAICGASITVPGLQESHAIKIPAGSQSGQELRIRGKGLSERDGQKSDLFYRLIIQAPEALGAVGLEQKVVELDQYYAEEVRKGLPARLLNQGT